ncbi:MAG: D-2-hydroxyacid dehydrogenase [Alphaproteobacteria bacterium]|nr:D-2-hydroxyacid dehydrogenase [Alphaproteobacteria bacterium]
MSKRPSVLVVHDRPDDVRDLLAGRFPDLPIAYAATPAEVGPALDAHRPEAVFSIKHSGFPGDAHRPVIDCPTVCWVHVGGSGYDHFVPWDAARVTLTNCAGVLAPFLAETVIAAILAWNRSFFAYRDQQRRRTWRPWPIQPLQEQTLLVVGAGAIGGEVARLAKVLGMTVLGIRAGSAGHPALDELHPPAALAALLPRADVVSLHVRATAATAGLFGREAFAAMKPGALFVNTSRGAVVDEAALIAGLGAGRPAGAYLDVFAAEPLPADSPLWAMDNVFITPHASDNVADWPRRFAGIFADNLDLWRKGEPLTRVVRA